MRAAFQDLNWDVNFSCKLQCEKKCHWHVRSMWSIWMWSIWFVADVDVIHVFYRRKRRKSVQEEFVVIGVCFAEHAAAKAVRSGRPRRRQATSTSYRQDLTPRVSTGFCPVQRRLLDCVHRDARSVDQRERITAPPWNWAREDAARSCGAEAAKDWWGLVYWSEELWGQRKPRSSVREVVCIFHEGPSLEGPWARTSCSPSLPKAAPEPEDKTVQGLGWNEDAHSRWQTGIPRLRSETDKANVESVWSWAQSGGHDFGLESDGKMQFSGRE